MKPKIKIATGAILIILGLFGIKLLTEGVRDLGKLNQMRLGEPQQVEQSK